MAEKEQSVATLVFPNEYLRQLNSIAGLTTQHVIYLKRKFVSKEGYELVRYPLSDCVSIEYREDLPVFKIAAGWLLLALLAFTVVMLAIYWGDLQPGTHIKIGALCLAAIWGVKVAFGGRRHRIEISLKDGSTLTWKSRAGERELMAPTVEKVVEFSRSAGLLHA